MVRKIEIETYPEADCAEGCLHPRFTYDLIGHYEAEQQFLQAKSSQRLHHAWLICGPKGIGKATLAYRMARIMLGARPLIDNSLDVAPDNPIAQQLEALGHGNFALIRRPYDHKTKKIRTEIPVSEIRALSKFFENTAADSQYWRICLIDSADALNRNSENAILKLLEEPPERTLFLLLSSAPGRLLPTIRSRCMQLNLRPIPAQILQDWLIKHIDAPAKIPAEIIEASVKLSRGAPGKALALVQNSEIILRPLSQFLSSLGRADHKLDMQISKALAMQSVVPLRGLFWDALQDVLHCQTLFAATGDWQGPFKPLPTQKPPRTWQILWEKTRDNALSETAINLDKTANMFDTLSQIRSH